MSGKPYQSSLIPYEDEILALRHRRPPMPYAQIAELLQQKHNLIIQGNAIFKFVKVRSGGRKVYSYSRNAPEKKAATAPAPRVTASGPRPPAVVAVTLKRSPSTIRFKFTPVIVTTRHGSRPSRRLRSIGSWNRTDTDVRD